MATSNPQVAELSKELMIAIEQHKFAQRQSQLTKNQLMKTNVTIAEVEKAPTGSNMYRGLGRL